MNHGRSDFRRGTLLPALFARIPSESPKDILQGLEPAIPLLLLWRD